MTYSPTQVIGTPLIPRIIYYAALLKPDAVDTERFPRGCKPVSHSQSNRIGRWPDNVLVDFLVLSASFDSYPFVIGFSVEIFFALSSPHPQS